MVLGQDAMVNQMVCLITGDAPPPEILILQPYSLLGIPFAPHRATKDLVR
jgi:hypothetical protein